MDKVMAQTEKPTVERILDAAEELFAERGFEATSLGVIADRVGIRQPGLYNHFQNKKDLYIAVMERLLNPWLEMMSSFPVDEFSLDKPDWYSTMNIEVVRYHAQRPNLPRLIYHAVLVGGWQLELLVNRWYKPMLTKLEQAAEKTKDYWAFPPELAFCVGMGFYNLLLGYVALAPLFKELYGFDPLSEDSVKKQSEFLVMFYNGLVSQKP